MRCSARPNVSLVVLATAIALSIQAPADRFTVYFFARCLVTLRILDFFKNATMKIQALDPRTESAEPSTIFRRLTWPVQ